MSEEKRYKIHEVQPAAYILKHPSSGKIYVGSTNKPGQRISRHRTLLKGGCHDNSLLQAAYNDNPVLVAKVMPVATREDAYVLEQRLVDEAMKDNACFNIGRDVRASNKGRTASVETRTKQSSAKLGMVRSAKSIEKSAAAIRGVPKSEEHRQKLSDAKKGKPQPASVRELLLARNAARAKTVEIDGKTYPGFRVAARELGVSRDTVKSRVKSPSPQWSSWHEV